MQGRLGSVCSQCIDYRLTPHDCLLLGSARTLCGSACLFANGVPALLCKDYPECPIVVI